MDFLSEIDFGELLGKVKDLLGKIDWGDVWDDIKPALGKVAEYLKKTPSVLLAFSVFLTLLTDPGAANTDTSILVSQELKTVFDASFMSEGLTTDGEVFYTSGAVSFAKYTALAKYEIGTMKRVQYKVFPVKWNLIKKGYDHIGGISYYDGMLYAAMESSSGKAAPCIAVFNADSLSYEASYDLPSGWFPEGIAWVAVDGRTGYLYTAAKGSADSLHAFQINAAMAHVEQIDLADGVVLTDLQGGEFYEEELYLSRDVRGSSVKEVWKVDVETGEAELFMTRRIGKADASASDITIFRSADGSLFHVTDYNGSLGVYVRNYIAV